MNYKDSYEHLTTPERLEQMRNGIEDIELINTYYNFARYLLISSSREGSLPSNLQGSGMKNLSLCGDPSIQLISI